jgi:hypothetical protein
LKKTVIPQPPAGGNERSDVDSGSDDSGSEGWEADDGFHHSDDDVDEVPINVSTV